jgi:DNA-binding transcriptional ArsR family regulator
MDENAEREPPDLQNFDGFSGSAERERLISSDKILSAVANDHRRAILRSLIDASDGTLGYDTLVDHIADRVEAENTDGVSDEHRQRVRIALHHTHLPKLAEAGIIDYEAEAGQIQFVGGELERDILTLVGPHAANE